MRPKEPPVRIDEPPLAVRLLGAEEASGAKLRTRRPAAETVATSNGTLGVRGEPSVLRVTCGGEVGLGFRLARPVRMAILPETVGEREEILLRNLRPRVVPRDARKDRQDAERRTARPLRTEHVDEADAAQVVHRQVRSVRLVAAQTRNRERGEVNSRRNGRDDLARRAWRERRLAGKEAVRLAGHLHVELQRQRLVGEVRDGRDDLAPRGDVDRCREAQTDAAPRTRGLNANGEPTRTRLHATARNPLNAHRLGRIERRTSLWRGLGRKRRHDDCEWQYRQSDCQHTDESTVHFRFSLIVV